jgi:hypothetical protein
LATAKPWRRCGPVPPMPTPRFLAWVSGRAMRRWEEGDPGAGQCYGLDTGIDSRAPPCPVPAGGAGPRGGRIPARSRWVWRALVSPMSRGCMSMVCSRIGRTIRGSIRLCWGVSPAGAGQALRPHGVIAVFPAPGLWLSERAGRCAAGRLRGFTEQYKETRSRRSYTASIAKSSRLATKPSDRRRVWSGL